MLGRGHEIMKGYDVWRRARPREIVIKQSGLESWMDNNILMAGDFYEGAEALALDIGNRNVYHDCTDIITQCSKPPCALVTFQ